MSLPVLVCAAVCGGNVSRETGPRPAGRTTTMKRTAVILLTLICAAAWMPLFADTTVLYNALGGTTAGDDSITTYGPLYESFSTGSSPVALTDVMARLGAGVLGSSASISVALYSDAGRRPGTLLVKIGTLADSLLPTLPSNANFDFPVNPPFQLNASTRYWIGFSSVNQSAASLAWTEDTSGTGVSLEFNYWNGKVSPNNSDAYK